MVVVGHSFSCSIFTPLSNITTFTEPLKSPLFSIIGTSTISVDVFFFLSGFLMCYLLAVKMYPKQGRINFLALYIHRYIRLTIPLAIITVVTLGTIKYIGNGANWK